MVEGGTEDLRQVTNVVPDKGAGQVEGAIADMGEQILDQANKSQLVSSMSKAQLDIAKLNNDYQIANQADPFKNMDQLKQNRQAIIDKYGSNISPFYQEEWNEKAAQLNENNDASVQAWGFKQSKDNTVLNVNTSLRDTMTLASANGTKFGQGQGNIDALLNFQQARQNIQQFGNEHLGETETNNLLFNFNKDYARSFVAGVASTNPARAAELMNDPRIAGQFDTQQKDEMIGVIKSTDKAQKLQQSFSEGVNNSQIMDLVNDPKLNYFEKRQQIDTLDMQGQISSKAAAAARRVLSSSKNVDSVTDEGFMSDTITKIYDLNNTSGLSNADYLTGAKNIQTDIMDAQSKGQLNVVDAHKLNDQMRTLTASRLSGATQGVASSFGDATKSFETLPPELRGTATRQLFDAQYKAQQTNGTSLTKDQMTTTAQQITDQINTKRRQAAQATIAKVNGSSALTTGGGMTAGQPLSDDDLQLLKDNNFTQDDANETAKRYGINPGDVVRRLRNGK